ncbi:MAG: DMT family transporter, partial [Dongiaceae bacterium]
ANVLLIQATAPFIAGLLGWLLMGERVRPRSLLTMLLALIGIAIMVSDSVARGSIAGTILAFIIAFAFAGAVVTTRRHREVRMTPATCLATLSAAIVALPLAAPLGVSASDFGYMTLFGAGQMAVGLILFTVGVRLVPAAEAALISVLETILGPIWVWLLFGENPGAFVVLGGAIVVAALIAHTLLDWRDSRVVPSAL